MKALSDAVTVDAFLEASWHAGAVLASEQVRLAWADQSALEKMSVGDICGHLFLIVRRVGKRLESAEKADRQPLTAEPAAWTWLRVKTATDLALPEHDQVRQDGAHVAAWGWEGVRSAYDARVRHVGELLQQGLPAATDVSGRSLFFSAYLATRVVELVVHADDLACSVGLTNTPPKLALTAALDALFEGSRTVHGDMAVLRALSRAERCRRRHQCVLGHQRVLAGAVSLARRPVRGTPHGSRRNARATLAPKMLFRSSSEIRADSSCARRAGLATAPPGP